MTELNEIAGSSQAGHLVAANDVNELGAITGVTLSNEGLERRSFAVAPLLGPLVRRRPGPRIPGAWDAFECAVRAVLGGARSAPSGGALGEGTPRRTFGPRPPPRRHERSARYPRPVRGPPSSRRPSASASGPRPLEIVQCSAHRPYAFGPSAASRPGSPASSTRPTSPMVYGS